MNKTLLLPFIMALGSIPARAEVINDEGFTQPLASLRYVRHDQGVASFNQATLALLNVPDPWESANRRLYHFNQRVDERALAPVVKAYRFFIPNLLRQGVTNFFSNLGDVSNLSNSLLQFKGKRSLQTGSRLLINTTVGLVGVWDPASKLGIVKESEDFGQTLGFYGVKQGPYMMLPILGPSNVRDASGRVVDFAAGESINFLNVAETSNDYREISAVKIVNEREITEFRYGQLNSPFEYEKLRFVFSRARELQVLE